MKGSMLTFSDTLLIVLSIIIGAYIIKRKQNAYKEEDQYIIIRWKGGKMKVDAVSQCPSRRMDMQ